MRTPSPRFLIGLVLVLAVSGGAAWFLSRPKDPGPAERLTIECVGGSEKTDLMNDPDIKRLLADKYGLVVKWSPLGSYDQVQLPTEEIQRRKLNCLWPGSASAQSVFESIHKSAFSGYRAETVLQSPEVIYAGPVGTDALAKAGIVQQRSGKYFVVDMKKLLLEHVATGSKWENLTGNALVGPVKIGSTDPAKSNSGFTMAQLELSILSTADPFKAPSVAEARAKLPQLRALYDAQGLQAGSSEFGFRQWLTQGAERSAPLYGGYESSVIQHIVQLGAGASALTNSVRILYPEPTIYNDHPVLALDAGGERFLQAMKDRDIQTIAWKKYGFRSSIHLDLNNVADFPAVALADQFRTAPAPNAEVTLALLACLSDQTKCH